MRLLVDTDILIDFALNREGYALAARELIDALEARPGVGCIAWHTASNFYYLVSSPAGAKTSRDFLYDLTRFLEIAPTTTKYLRIAAKLPMKDFEDAMQVAAAMAFDAELIVTRNVRDFGKSPIPAVKPREAVARLVGGNPA